MKSWVSGRHIAAYILALVLFGALSTAFAAVGRTPGTYQVSPAGAATYTIPIWAPRGPNGLQPQLALSYNSQSGSGYLGVGWGLSGLSSIYRCPQTYAQDPAPAPVTLTGSDVFCMDGQRLRLTGGTYGDAGSTYQTEVANFANVTAYGSQGSGPAYFEVQGRDGRTYEYGNGGGSQVLANGTTAWIWYLDKVIDRAGNTMTIAYCSDGNSYCTASGATASGTAVPVTISWTPSSYGSTSYNYTIQFAYSANVPQPSIYGYVGGFAYSNTSLLSTITVEYSGSTVKKYALTYTQSPTTGRDELTQVEECADAGQTNCLAPTTFTYQNGQVGVSTSAGTAISSGAVEIKTHNDFNGDGYNDLTYCNGGSPNIIYVAFASSGGYGSPINTGITCNAPLYRDLAGSGKTGILVPNGTDWYYYTWNGSSFSGQDTGLAYDSTAAQYVLADVNGDGLPDLVASHLTAQSIGGRVYFTYSIAVRLNTSSGSSVSFSSSINPWYTQSAYNELTATMISDTDRPYGATSFGTLKSLDFNGDGKEDIALQVITEVGTSLYDSVYELISGTSSFTANLITSGTTASSYGATAFLDFNGDACTDYAFNSVIYVSGCNGSVTQQINLGTNVVGAMDWDGDGHTDILVQNGSTLGVYLSEGNGISSLKTTSIPYSSSNLYFSFDSNGDGLDDLGVYSSGGAVSYYPHNGAGQKPDLLISATDGYGNRVSPAYTSILQGSYSDYTYSSPVYPYAPFRFPLYVVSNAVYSDPTNPPSGTYSKSYDYIGAWTNLQGRGFSNFISVETHDSRDNVWRHDCYENKFPFSGTRACTRLSLDQAGNQLIRTQFGNHAVTTLDGTAYNERYFIYQNTWTDQIYQVSWTAGSGSSTGPLIENDVTTYAYDSYGNATSVATTKTDDDSGSPYVGDSWTTTITNTPDVNANSWCLTLSSEVQVSYAASNGSPAVTRTRQYTPDTTSCRYTQITTEPSSSTYEVIEALGYDSFGNINSDTITGIGMTARQSTASWGATGQFPMSVTDATNATTQFNYNFSYGLVSSETDPNGVATSWQYGDGFGRLTQETRADGTYTIYSYNDCVNWSGCLMGAHTLARAHYFYNADGSLETDGTVYYDELERPIVWNDMMLGGTQWNRNEVRYDNLGRVVQRAAPCVWSAVTTPCSYWTTTSYDILNRPTQVQRPINQNDSSLQTTSYAYEGRTTTITDPYGHTRTLVHDVNGWLRQTKDALGYTVTLGYDAAGAKTSAADSLGNSLWTGTYAYGLSPFLIGESDMDRGTWGYTIDALGERTAWTDPKAQHFYATYDALSRMVTRTEPDLFTQWTWGSSAASHNIGRLQSVCYGSGTTCTSSANSETNTYDSLARLSQRVTAYPSWGSFTMTWQYSTTTGLLDTLTYPQSTSQKQLQLKYTYQSGILQSITDILDSPNITLWQADAESPAGQITQETLGNGLVTSRAYDSVTQWLASVQSGPGGGATRQNQSFLYDEVGDVTQRQDNNLGLTENFYYDNDYRLSYSTLNGTQNLSLTYDPMGDITSRSDVAAGATWTYDPVRLHQVTQAGSAAYKYVYDANGNMETRQGVSITWSSYNYPTYFNTDANGESVGFSYGADRRAWYEQTNGSAGLEKMYDVDGLFDDVNYAGTDDFRHYVYANGVPVAIVSRKSGGTNTIYYLLTDHQGSIAAITDSTGAVVVGESFAAYGARRNPSSWSGAPSSTDLTTIAGITRHGYTFQGALGQQTGLIYMVGRVQDSITGRFLSADPTIPHPMSAQSYNRYSYTENNPLTYADPTGFEDTVQYYNGPWDYADILIKASPLPPDGTLPYNGDQLGLGGGARGSTGPAAGNGDGGTGNSTPSSQPQTPQKPKQPQKTHPPSAVCQAAQVAAGAASGAAGGAVTGGTLGGEPGALVGAAIGAIVGGASALASQGGFWGGAAAAVGSLVGHMTQGTSVAGFLQVATDTAGGVAGDDHPAGYIGTAAGGTATYEGVAAAAEGTEIGAATAEGGVAGGAGAVVYLGTHALLSAGLHAMGCP